jgi:hypothetical protein
MNKPTAADYRADTRFDWVGMGLPIGNPDPLDAEINSAWAYVEVVTGRDLDTLDAADNLASVASDAVKLRTFQQAIQHRSSFINSAIGSGTIKSFSVPGYSETRDTTSSTKSIAEFFFNPWVTLDELLWLLATDAKKQEAQAKKDQDVVPFSDVREIDWFYPLGSGFPY